MSREIKFRAWDSATGKVSEPFDVKESWGDYLIDFDDYSTDGALDSIIFEQYTGLIDKNGKEIYEGDIVNVIGVGIAQVIDSLSGEWMLYYMREPDEINNGFVSVVPKNKPSGLWKATTTSYIEVIGNIHEPPKDFRPEHLKRMGVSISKGGEE